MFRLESEKTLLNCEAKARLFVHDSGLRFLSMETKSPENVFAVCIPTCPVDDTGVTHIIEHSVLAGSRKYPVKDPFIQLYRSSMATFLNAMTYHDFTVYPIATAVDAEYFSLADVYFDAVFCPRMEREKFHQEGWRYDFAGKNIRSPLIINGIVYNEMRGVHYDLQETLERETGRLIYPGRSQQYVSGGTPDGIPKLTYRGYRKYYTEHYHPSRALVFCSGNIPTEQKMEFLEKRLALLPRTTVPPAPYPKPQPLSEFPDGVRRRVAFSPSGPDEHGVLLMRWGILDHEDAFLNIAFSLLDDVLLGTEGAPLKKRILDSQLCDSLLDCGYLDASPEDTLFEMTMGGVRSRNFMALEKLVRQTLAEIAEKGFTEDEVAQAFAGYACRERQKALDSFLEILEDVSTAWAYGRDPMKALDDAEIWEALRKRLKEEPAYLQNLMREYLCDNPHRVTVEFVPDASLMRWNDVYEKKRLARIKAGFSAEKCRKIKEAALELKRRQAMPDSPEALAAVPRLTRETVPETPLPRPGIQDAPVQNGLVLQRVRQSGNGLSFLSFAVPFQPSSYEELVYAEAYSNLLFRVGTETAPYHRNALRWAKIGASAFSRLLYLPYLTSGGWQPRLYVEYKLCALDEYWADALQYFGEQLAHGVFTEQDYLQQICRRRWQQYQLSMVAEAQRLASSRAAAGFGWYSDYGENMTGFAGGARLRRWSECFQEAEAIAQAGAGLLARGVCGASFMGTEGNGRAAVDLLRSFSVASAPCELPGFVPPEIPEFLERKTGRREHFSVSTPVAFYARAYEGVSCFNKMYAPLSVYLHLIGGTYLWEEVRVKGGAYGAYARPDVYGAPVRMGSSQDPDVSHTQALLDHLPEMAFDWTEEDVEKAVISMLRGYHIPLRGGTAVEQALQHWLDGCTEEFRSERYRELLAVRLEDVKLAAEWFWKTRTEWNDCVVSQK